MDDWIFVTQRGQTYWLNTETGEVRDTQPLARTSRTSVVPPLSELYVPPSELPIQSADMGNSLRVVHTSDEVTQAQAFLLKTAVYSVVFGALALAIVFRTRVVEPTTLNALLVLFATFSLTLCWMWFNHNRHSPQGIALHNARSANRRADREQDFLHDLIQQRMAYLEKRNDDVQ